MSRSFVRLWNHNSSGHLLGVFRGALAATLFVVVIVSRFIAIDADPPSEQNHDDLGDEGYWSSVGRDLGRTGVIDLDTNFAQASFGAPLATLYNAFLVKLSGDGGYWIGRYITAVHSIGLLGIVVWWLCRRNMKSAAAVFVVTYGLGSITWAYSRMCHLEQQVLFYILGGLLLLGRARSQLSSFIAGFVFGLAILVKVVAVVYVPAVIACLMLCRQMRPAFGFVAGVLLTTTPLVVAMLISRTYISPTFSALASYHRNFTKSWREWDPWYFWLSPMVMPYMPVLIFGALLLPWVRNAIWAKWRPMAILVIVTVIVLAFAPYWSVSRHMLIFVPLLVLVSVILGEASKHDRSYIRAIANVTIFLGCLWVALCGAVVMRSTLFAPRFSLLGACAELRALTTSQDVAIGPHVHLLTSAGRAAPRMSLQLDQWSLVDPVGKVAPSIVLESIIYNGVDAERLGQFWPVTLFPFRERLTRLEYCNGLFVTDVYRVFTSAAELAKFKSIEGGRPTPYDGVLYSLFRSSLPDAWMLKAIIAAESRGDNEISHLKVVRTSQCMGMFGLSYATAKAIGGPQLRLLHRVPHQVDKTIIFKDGRFDPELASTVTLLYVQELQRQFSMFDEHLRFTFAGYNAGPELIRRAIAMTTDADPCWNAVYSNVTVGLMEEFYPYKTWSDDALDYKRDIELRLYVPDAIGVIKWCILYSKEMGHSVGSASTVNSCGAVTLDPADGLWQGEEGK